MTIISVQQQENLLRELSVMPNLDFQLISYLIRVTFMLLFLSHYHLPNHPENMPI